MKAGSAHRSSPTGRQGIGTPDRWIRQPAHVMDIMPTLIEVAGATYPATFNGNTIQPPEGTSLLPAMRGDALPERAIGVRPPRRPRLRQGDWKLVWSKRMPHEIQWELYNLAEDRCETNDLAGDYPERVRAMAAEWEQWARRVNVIYPSQPAEAVRTNTQETPSPIIAKQIITITAHVVHQAPTGVIVAHGGREQGYAVHLHERKTSL